MKVEKQRQLKSGGVRVPYDVTRRPCRLLVKRLLRSVEKTSR